MMGLTTQRQELYAPHLDSGTFYIGVAQGMLLASPVGDDKVEVNPARSHMGCYRGRSTRSLDEHWLSIVLNFTRKFPVN